MKNHYKKLAKSKNCSVDDFKTQEFIETITHDPSILAEVVSTISLHQRHKILRDILFFLMLADLKDIRIAIFSLKSSKIELFYKLYELENELSISIFKKQEEWKRESKMTVLDLKICIDEDADLIYLRKRIKIMKHKIEIIEEVVYLWKDKLTDCKQKLL